MTAKKNFLTKVESVRGIAALYVAFAHTMIYLLFAHYTRPVFDLSTAREVVLRVVEGLIHGPMAVMVFFVISGLVIGRSLDRTEDKTPSRYAYVIFLVRRFLRLYPAHIASMVGIVVIGWFFLAGRPPIDFSAYQPPDEVYFTDWLDAVFNPLYLKTVIGNLAMVRWSMNLVVWSLYVEVCVAPLLPILHKISRQNSLYVDGIAVSGLLAVGVIMSGRLWIEYWFAFYLGMIVQTRGRDWARFVTGKMGSGVAVAVSYVVLAVPAIVAGERSPFVAIAQAFAAFSLISLVVWCDTAAMFRFLDHPVLRWNGRLSYSFYLWHYFILTMAVRGLYMVFSPADLYRYEIAVCVLTAVVTVGLALGVAQLSYTFIELPFIELGRRVGARIGGLKRPIGLPPGAQPAS